MLPSVFRINPKQNAVNLCVVEMRVCCEVGPFYNPLMVADLIYSNNQDRFFLALGKWRVLILDRVINVIS